MNNERAAQTSPFALQQSQAIASFGLLVLLAIACVMTDCIARNRSLEHWSMLKSREFAEKNRTLFSDTGNFIDFEERLLLDEIPRADYSHGGIYFFGTSNTKWAFNTIDLPVEQRRLLGNYGIGAASHQSVLQFIRLLVRERAFLSAGTRDLVILGVSFHLGFRDSSSGYFASLVRRRGLYRIANDGEIMPAPVNAIERWLQTEKARSSGFLWNVGRLAKNWAKTLTGPTPPLTHNPERYRRDWRSYMGPNWQEHMDVEIEYLRETIELVRAYQAQIKVILLPQGTWMTSLPFPKRYETQVRAVCQETSTQLIDLSHVMPDADFVDSNHLTVKGQEKLRSLVMAEIMQQVGKFHQLDNQR